MTDRGSSGGGMTGATGELTPDSRQSDFEPAELREVSEPGEPREVSDPAHRAVATDAQAARAQLGGADRPDDGPTDVATRDSGHGSEHGLSPGDPADWMEGRPPPEPAADPARGQRDGGDEGTHHEDHF